MKSTIVQKFGGTSVQSLDHIRNVAKRIRSSKDMYRNIVVVVSAMGSETDRLLDLGKSFHESLNDREMDVLVSAGEQVSAALLCMALNELGSGAVSLLGHQIPIRTDSKHQSANVQFVAPQSLQQQLNRGNIVVVAGYQGVNDSGDITTLGRGGSDLTAVALAAAVEAETCEIYTDVPGIFTANPQTVDDARLIQKITYDEMLELASLGARVLQARSVILAKRYGIPIHVRSTFDEGAGTWVLSEEEIMEAMVVSGISCARDEAKISVRHLPDPVSSISKLFTALEESDVLVDVIVQDRSANGKANLTFTVPRQSYEKTLATVKIFQKADPQMEVLSHDRIAKVSAVGLGMKNRSGVASRVFRALAAEGIEVMAVSTSDIKISCVIDDRYAELAVRILHDEFGLAKEPN